MDVTAVLNTLLHGNQLKRTARTGWAQRGVPNAENVAAHSFGVVFVALVLAQVVEETIDLGRLLAMAALHDLPEALTTDISTPAWRYLPPGIKTEIERGAMQEMLGETQFAPIRPFFAKTQKKHRCYAVPSTQINSNSMATYSVGGELPVVKDQMYACPLATTVAV